MKDVKIALIFLLALVFQSCLSEEKSKPIFSKDNLKSTFFQIDNTRDTLLVGQKGVQLFIPKNAFLNQNSKPVSGKIDIELKEAIELADMVKGGLHTRSEDGRILESSGMIYFNATQNHEQLELASDSKIGVAYPNTGIKGNSKVFYRNETGAWSESHDLENSEIVTEITLGETLFRNNCRSCHTDNLREDLTGPALGNVHLFRKKDWLKKYTRNSQKMINEGDSLAVCTWHQWKPTVMNSFENLSDKEIEAIYLWIENESLIQGIDSFEMKFVTACEVNNEEGTQTLILNNEEIVSDTFLGRMLNIDFVFRNIEGPISSVFYANQLGWSNIDRFLDDPRTEKRPFFVEIENPLSEIQVSIIFKYRNLYLVAYKKPDGRFSFTHGESEKLTTFPIGEKAILIATGTNKNDESFYAEKEIIIGANETETLNLQPKSIEDILNEIDKMFD